MTRRALHYGTVVIDHVPARWSVAKIDDKMIDTLGGFSWAKNKAVAVGIPHLRPFNIADNGEVIITNNTVHIPLDAVTNVAEYKILPGDVLYNNTNSRELVGKSAIARKELEVAFSNHINRLRIRNTSKLLPEWLNLCLRYLQRTGFFEKHANKWIGQAGFSITALHNIEIPTPPIEEQVAIIARLESYLAEVREIRDLHAAIDLDVMRVIESALEEVFTDLEKRFSSNRRIDSFTTVKSGGTPDRSYSGYYNGTIPWVKTGELRDNIINGTVEHITLEATQNSNAKKMPVGTLLVAMYGQGQTRGRTGLLAIEAATNQACCGIYPNQDVFLPRYLQYWFMFMYKELRKRSEARGGNQSNLNAGMIKELKPPLPGIPVQQQIVHYLDDISQETRGMQATQTEDRVILNLIEQAIIEQAFRGEL